MKNKNYLITTLLVISSGSLFAEGFNINSPEYSKFTKGASPQLSKDMSGPNVKYEPAVNNPFAFCSGPKPCDKCQPARRHWDYLCPKDNERQAEENSASGTAAQQAQAAIIEQKTNNNAVWKQAMEMDTNVTQQSGAWDKAAQTDPSLYPKSVAPNQFGDVAKNTNQSIQNVFMNGQPVQIVTNTETVTKLEYGNNGQYVNKDYVTGVSRTVNGSPISEAEYQKLMNSSQASQGINGSPRLF